MAILSCIGAGRLGQTLCNLFSQQLTIGQVINTSMDSSRRAIDFIGAGSPATIDNLKQADIWLIATPDHQIETVTQQLHSAEVLTADSIIFHCSGLLSSSILQGGKDNLNIASVHPIHSFANPRRSIKGFSGCHCAIEGSEKAVTDLSKLFTSIGALPFALDSQHKSVYHAATVMACNYLVSLLEVSHQMLQAAGIESTQKSPPLEALIRQTLDNYFSLGATEALTGPIARGDVQTVKTHSNALEKDTDVRQWKQLYAALGNATLPIAAAQGQASEEQLRAIARELNSLASDEK